MIKEAIEKILDLGKDNAVDVGDGRLFWERKGTPIKPAADESLGTVLSLSGVIAALETDLKSDAEANVLRVVIRDNAHVSVVSCCGIVWGDRDTGIQAEYRNKGFRFNEYHDLESFIIGVQCQFDDTPEKAGMLAFASTITGEEVVTNTDDGISQTLQVKDGFRKGEATRNPIVKLKPFRTFPEVPQPESRFLLRVRKSGSGPQLALFEADGGQWIVDAVRNIVDWFNRAEVVKQYKIPVIG